MRLLGNDSVRNYDGSMGEWANREDTPLTLRLVAALPALTEEKLGNSKARYCGPPGGAPILYVAGSSGRLCACPATGDNGRDGRGAPGAESAGTVSDDAIGREEPRVD